MLNPHVHDSDIHEGSQSLLYIATPAITGELMGPPLITYD